MTTLNFEVKLPTPPAGFVECDGAKVLAGDQVFDVLGTYVVIALVPHPHFHLGTARYAHAAAGRHPIVDGRTYYVNAETHEIALRTADGSAANHREGTQ